MTYDNSNSFQPHEHARALRRLGGRTDSQALRSDLKHNRAGDFPLPGFLLYCFIKNATLGLIAESHKK